MAYFIRANLSDATARAARDPAHISTDRFVLFVWQAGILNTENTHIYHSTQTHTQFNSLWTKIIAREHTGHIPRGRLMFVDRSTSYYPIYCTGSRIIFYTTHNKHRSNHKWAGWLIVRHVWLTSLIIRCESGSEDQLIGSLLDTAARAWRGTDTHAHTYIDFSNNIPHVWDVLHVYARTRIALSSRTRTANALSLSLLSCALHYLKLVCVVVISQMA